MVPALHLQANLDFVGSLARVHVSLAFGAVAQVTGVAAQTGWLEVGTAVGVSVGVRVGVREGVRVGVRVEVGGAEAVALAVAVGVGVFGVGS